MHFVVLERLLEIAAFLERATTDLREILRFGRLFGAACVLVVVVLVANTIYMAVNERRRELGVLRAIGFKARHAIGQMDMAESKQRWGGKVRALRRKEGLTQAQLAERLDISASYLVNDGLMIYGGVKNVTDEQPFITDNAFPASPRGTFYFIGLDWSM